MSCSCINDCTCQVSNCLPSSNLVIPCFSTTTTSTSLTTTTTTTTQIISYCYTVTSAGSSNGYCNISWTDHDGVFQNDVVDSGNPDITFCAKEFSVQKTCYVGRTATITKGQSLCISDDVCPIPPTTTTTSSSTTTTTTTVNTHRYIFFQSEADGTETVTYTNCNNVVTSLPLVQTDPELFATALVCTNDIDSIDITSTVDVYYMILGNCIGDVCSPYPCSCYVIMNTSNTESVYISYLPCNYDVNNPQLSTGNLLNPLQSAYLCCVGIPSVSDSMDDTESGTTLPYSPVTLLGSLSCADDSCEDPHTSYCYTISATGGNVDYAYVDYEDIVNSDTLISGNTITICAQPGTIIKMSGSGNLTIGPAGSDCTATGGDCIL